jgi:hypothetical protein
MRFSSDAIRGVRWAGGALALALVAITISRMAGTPAGETPDGTQDAQADVGPEISVGDAVAVVPDAEPPRKVVTSPPEVPPPPPLRRAAPVRQRVADPPRPVEPAVTAPPPNRLAEALQAPRVWNATPSQPVRNPEAQQDNESASEIAAVPAQPQLGEPGRPLIVRPEEPQPEENPALRMLRSVGRVFGIGRRRGEPEPVNPEPAPAGS